MTTQQKRSARRAVLSTLVAGGAATAAALAGRLVPHDTAPASPAEPRPDDAAGKGYQESAHVRKYYRTAA